MDRRRQVVWGAVVIALVFATASFANEGGFRRYARLKRDLASLEERTERLRVENERLTLEASRLKHEDAAIERAARENLGLVKPGEIVLNLESP